jgi:hypothetical protein
MCGDPLRPRERGSFGHFPASCALKEVRLGDATNWSTYVRLLVWVAGHQQACRLNE